MMQLAHPKPRAFQTQVLPHNRPIFVYDKGDKGVSDAAHPPEGDPAKAGSLSDSTRQYLSPPPTRQDLTQGQWPKGWL